ncbi:cell division protein FtsK, partial [Streptomyces sp. NPDC050610]
YVGVASMAHQGRPGFTRVRTPYVADDDAARIAADTAHLTRDPADLLEEASGRHLRRPALLTKEDVADATEAA